MAAPCSSKCSLIAAHCKSCGHVSAAALVVALHLRRPFALIGNVYGLLRVGKACAVVRQPSPSNPYSSSGCVSGARSGRGYGTLLVRGIVHSQCSHGHRHPQKSIIIQGYIL
ncbi:hypothetical protein XELAEV_18037228mg [Xenopus laevis]|uniref:Uncharacterized protein n=1 Tax=Xenopus laevis TaxID=8355 RepID=A0A974CD06_XENLA|nr:hypothetical protein XELAEV_18037228mg [Xenopus laevis]